MDVSPIGIDKVSVSRLLGLFDYEIPFGDPASEPRAGSVSTSAELDDRLVLLYGRNGSGKTTLLRLLYHVLSSHHARRHAEAIGEIRFSSVEVAFSNGALLRYWRPADEVEGPFEAQLTLGGETYPWRRVDRESSEFRRRRQREVEDPFLGALQALAISPVFLPDSRALEADALSEEMTDLRDEVRYYAPAAGQRADRLVRATREAELDAAISRADAYLDRVVFSGSRSGTTRIDTVYRDLVQAIVKNPPKAGRPRDDLLPKLGQRVEALGLESERYAAYALMDAVPHKELQELLNTAQRSQGPLLGNVLRPYLDGLEARLEALKPGFHAVRAFVDSVNGFLDGKRVTYAPVQGIQVLSELTGETIEPSDLSSGERQILQLFSNLLALREETRLFIVDEPEISLNPDWQRKLISSLLAVTAETPMQLLVATHSIEILAKHRGRMRALVQDPQE